MRGAQQLGVGEQRGNEVTGGLTVTVDKGQL